MDAQVIETRLFGVEVVIEPFSDIFKVREPLVSQLRLHQSKQAIVGRGKIRKIRRIRENFPAQFEDSLPG